MKIIYTLAIAICTILLLNSKVNGQSQNLPYTMGFTTSIEVFQWQEFRLGETDFYNWSVPSGANGRASHDYPVGANATDTTYDWLTSPPLNITADAKLSCEVGYFYFQQNLSVDYFGVWMSNGSRNPNDGDYVEVMNMTDQPSQSNITFENVLLPLTGGACYLAFVYRETQNWYTINLDDIHAELVIPNAVIASELLNVAIYPNPFADYFTIQAATNDLMNYSIFSSTGQIVTSGNARGSSRIPTSHLTSGIYFLQVNEGKEVRRMVIVKE